MKLTGFFDSVAIANKTGHTRDFEWYNMHKK